MSTRPRIRTIPADRFTPLGLARKLDAAALLESSSFIKGRERYSIILAERAFSIRQTGLGIFFEDERGSKRVKTPVADILDLCEYFAGQHGELGQDLPFPAGGLGFVSYEFARRCDRFRLPDREDPTGLPEAAFLFGHVYLVFDHYTELIYLIGVNYAEHEIDLVAAMARLETRLHDLDFNYLSNDDQAYPVAVVEDDHRDSFTTRVEQLRREIIEGNLLQAVLSRRVVLETSLSALEAYRRLRRVNPSPYLFYLDFGSYQLLGASPEMHLKCRQGRAKIKPIAGTRRRGATDTEDKALEVELTTDPKERAEHLMLVDLARNDLGRICDPGSVVVERFMETERFSHVMHLVSEVSGRMKPGLSTAAALRATFPAGTVSGAPKIRAVETLAEVEGAPRGFYAGIVGYFEPGGGLDSCITIRSALAKDGRLYLQAGAGIVYDSRPHRELEETDEKLAALTSALRLGAVRC